MIASLDGVVAEVRDSSLILQAGAFGLEVFAPKPTLMVCRPGEALRLHTHLVVKEELLALYGFHDADMHLLFTYLIGVSGIGPKGALAMLSAMPTTIIAAGILQGDAGLLAGAPGIGKKTAERIILDLKKQAPRTPHGGLGRDGSAQGDSLPSGRGRGRGASGARLPRDAGQDDRRRTCA